MAGLRTGPSRACGYQFFTIEAALSVASWEKYAMAEDNKGQVERRRAARAALHLSATLREGSRKAEARVIDMSTHGCRVECSCVVADGSWVWLAIE